MSTAKTPKFYIILSAVIIGMAVMLLKENEGRAAAEAKAQVLEQKLQSMNIEKSTLVEELEAQVNEMQVRLADAETRLQEMQAARDTEVAALTSQVGLERAAHETTRAAKEAELESLQSRSTAEANGLRDMLKSKGAENQELASDLEKASQKYSALLQKKEALEAQNLDLDRSLSDLRRELESCQAKSQAQAVAAAAPPASSSAD